MIFVQFGPCENYLTGIFFTKIYETKKHEYGIIFWFVCYSQSMLYVFLIIETLLTLGAHAPEGYGSCPVCVSVCVCVCVCPQP